MANDPFDALYAPLPGEPRPTDPRSRSLGDKYDTFARLMRGYGPMGELTFPTRDAARARLGSATMGFGDEGLGALRSVLEDRPYGGSDGTLAEERYANRRLWDTDPGTAVKETVHGMLPYFAAPASLAGHAAPWLARLAGYTGMGAAQGAVQGFGEGQGLDDRLKHAGTGATVGAALMGVPFLGYHAAKAAPALTAGVVGGALGAAFPTEAQGASPPKGFFSVLEQAIAGSKQRSMPAEQWSSYLTPGRREVTVGDLKFPLRDEELKWSGLPGYLEGKQPGERISVDDLLRQLERRPMPELKNPKGELTKFTRDVDEHENYFNSVADSIAERSGATDDGHDDLVGMMRSAVGRGPGGVRNIGELTGIELTPLEAHFIDTGLVPGPGARYKSNILPGPTTGYGEELTKFRAGKQWDPATEAEHKGLINAEELTTDEYLRLQELNRLHGEAIQSGYTSDHFGSEGQDLLSHSRWSRRQTDDGRPVHVVEEIQSDWHQQGREKGYKRELTSEEQNEYDSLKHKSAGFAYRDLLTPAERDRAITLEQAKFSGIPQAPFSKTYHELELKKNLARAVANGDEYLALTTGTQQADRWNQLLQKDLKQIEWMKGEDGRYDLYPYGKDDKAKAFLAGKTDKELRDLLGKEMSDKILNSGKDEGVLTGDNLSIGGAGMRHTYDEVYRGYLEKLAKQYGGEVTRVRVPDARGHDTFSESALWDQFRQLDAENSLEGMSDRYAAYKAKHTPPPPMHEVPAIRITDAMRDRVKKSGLPLFTAPAATGATGLTGYLGLKEPPPDAY